MQRAAWMLIALVCAACASSPRGGLRATQLVQFNPIPGRQCQPRQLPEIAPVGDLVDVAQLTDSLRTPRLRDLRGRVVYTLLYRAGGLVHLEPIQTSLPDTTRAAITRIMDAVVKRNYPAPRNHLEHWGWQLGIDLDTAPRFQLGRQEICLPAEDALGPSTLSSRGGLFNEGSAYHANDRLRVRIEVAEDGTARGYVVRPSVSGAYDAVAPNAIAMRSYLPMLVDRIPTRASFETWFP